VSYDQELRVHLELFQEPGKAADVRVIEGSVDLVHEAEGARLRQIDAEQQRHGDECPLAGGEQVDALGSLASRRGVDVDVALERIVLIRQAQLALATAEKSLEHLGEVCLHRQKGLEEHGPRCPIDFPDSVNQRLPCADQIVALGCQELQPLDLLAVFLDRERVHRTDSFQSRHDPRGF
jgi:hypothetical protein